MVPAMAALTTSLHSRRLLSLSRRAQLAKPLQFPANRRGASIVLPATVTAARLPQLEQSLNFAAFGAAECPFALD
jgi:hypothetical protein